MSCACDILNAAVDYGLLRHLVEQQIRVMFASCASYKIVPISKQPFLLATVHSLDVDQMTWMLFEVLLERAKLELHSRVCEIQQTIWHINVIEGARQRHYGWIVTKVYSDTLRMRRRRSARGINRVRGYLAAITVGIVRCVTRVARSDSK